MEQIGQQNKVVKVGNTTVANHLPMVLFGGVNVMESPELVLETAAVFAEVTSELGIPWVFKASFDKANRTSLHSFRGPGLAAGLKILADVKAKFQVPVITDIHLPEQAAPVAEVCDILQIPAFLARQTDLIHAAARCQKPLHIKKPQFLAPEDMAHIVAKCQEAGNSQVILCERGASFGYHNLVVDMLGFPIMKNLGAPVTFDATHSLQQPGGLGHAAGGRRQYVTPLARAGLAMGIAGVFLETHPDPSSAKCDGPCALNLALLKPFLTQLKMIDDLVKSLPELDTRR